MSKCLECGLAKAEIYKTKGKVQYWRCGFCGAEWTEEQ